MTAEYFSKLTNAQLDIGGFKHEVLESAFKTIEPISPLRN